MKDYKRRHLDKGTGKGVDEMLWDEIRKHLNVEDYKIKEMECTTSIVFDGRQYSVRIPKMVVESLDIDPKKDKFKFIMRVGRTPRHKDSRVVAVLVRNGIGGKNKRKTGSE